MKLRLPFLPMALCSTAILLSPILHSQSSAAILAQDSFDYTSGASLAGLNGGSGFASGWTNAANTPATITSTTYDHQIAGGALISGGSTGLQIHSNGAVAPATFVQTPAAIHRELSQTYSNDSIFVSFVVRQTSSGVTNSDRFAFWVGNSTTAVGPYGGMLQTGSSGFFLRTDSAAPTPVSAGSPRFAANTTYLIVLEFSKSISGESALYDQARLWVNPGADDLGTPLLFDGDVGVNALSSFSTIGIEIRNQSTSDKDYYFDNFVMGTTWGDVVPAAIPEPSTWAFLVLGAGGLLARAAGIRGKRRS